MRKLFLWVVSGVLVLVVAPARAADPYCATGVPLGVGQDGQAGASCVFTADGGPHFFIASGLSPFRIFVDADGDGRVDPGERVLVNAPQNEADPASMQTYGTFEVATGTDVTVQVIVDQGAYLGEVFAK